MTKTTITARQSFCADVTFQVDFWKTDKASQFKLVVETWTQVTGLAFDKIASKDFSHDVCPANEDQMVLQVPSPLTNRSDVTFFWAKLA